MAKMVTKMAKKRLSYWERRFLQTQVNMQRHSAKYEAGMVSRLDAAYKSANDDLQKWYARYAKTDGTMNITDAQALMSGMNAKTWQITLDEFRAKAIEGGHDQELDLEYIKSRVSRLQALQFQMQQHMAEFNDQESPKFQDALASQFDDTYMRTNYNIQMARQQIAANFQTFDDQELAMVVNKPWVGSNFSKRLWKDTVNDLPALLVNNLSQSITLGYSYKRIEREMRNHLQDFSKGVIHRLVITEMAHVSEEATAESYAQMDVQEYTYLATLESHTCEVCRKLDGTHYKTADRKPGVNYPPIHAYCRCTTVPYEPALESLPSRRWAKDPDTGKREMIDNTSFEDWKKNGYKANAPKPEKRNYRDFDQAGLDANTDYIQKLPENQRDAIHKYTLGSYAKRINNSLRYGVGGSETISEIESNLHKALQHPLGSDTHVYRGLYDMPSKWLESLDQPARASLQKTINTAAVGIDKSNVPAVNAALAMLPSFEVMEPAYMSTTYDKRVTQSFSTNIRLDLNVPKEINAVAIESVSNFEHEKEILIDKRAKIKITGIEVSDNGMTVVLKGEVANGSDAES